MSLAFANISLSIGMILVVYTIIKNSLSKLNISVKRKSKIFFQTTVVAIFYFTYTCILSHFQILFDFGMPPRFPIFLLVPLTLLILLFVRKSRRSDIIRTLPVHWLILFQSFRILVELILAKMYTASIVPIEATFYGINFDILVGITALPLAYLVWKNKVSNKLLILWNVWGILMVMIVAMTITTCIYFPSVWGYSAVPVSTQFLEMPLMLLPTFLAPLAIFTHIVTLLRWKSKD